MTGGVAIVAMQHTSRGFEIESVARQFPLLLTSIGWILSVRVNDPCYPQVLLDVKGGRSNFR